MRRKAVAWFPYDKKTALMKFVFLGLVLVELLFSGCDPSGNRDKAVTIPDSTTNGKPPVQIKNILFFGNSITAGFGLDSAAGFTALLQARIDSLNLPYQTINSGLPGETTAHGVTRVDDVLSLSFDIFVLELGGNDGLQKLSVSEMSKNLQTIIDKVKRKYPTCKIVLAGMELPLNLGQTYTAAFKAVFPQLAAKDTLYLIPFLLDGVGGIPSLNQADGIHPNVQGEKIVADNVWVVLHPLL